MTFTKMSLALAVQMKGLGFSLLAIMHCSMTPVGARPSHKQPGKSDGFWLGLIAPIRRCCGEWHWDGPWARTVMTPHPLLAQTAPRAGFLHYRVSHA